MGSRVTLVSNAQPALLWQLLCFLYTFAATIKCGHQTFSGVRYGLILCNDDVESWNNDVESWNNVNNPTCGVCLLISIVPYVICKAIAIILTISLIATTNSGFCSETVGPQPLIIALIILETGSVYLEFYTSECLFIYNKLIKSEFEGIDCDMCICKILQTLCTPLRWASGCSVLHVYIYTTCVILQWALYANEKATGVGCTSNYVLAAAIFSSLATFLKYGYQTCRIYSEYYTHEEEEKGIRNVCAAMSCCSAIPFALCKVISTILTITAVIAHNSDSCGSETIGPPPILSALAILEPVSVLLEFSILECLKQPTWCCGASKHFNIDMA